MPSRTLRASGALLLAASLALTGTDVAAAARPGAAPSATQPLSEHTSVAAEADTLDLRGDGISPHRDGRTASVQKWTVRTLWYYESLPAKWDWSLSTAVAKWNASGGRIRLARTIYPGKAQVRIGYGDIGSSAGMATLGATRNARVYLSSRFSTMNALDARNRVLIMNVFAHELGHVLGFRHTATDCTLMAPVLDIDGCSTVPPDRPGYYKCRTIDTTLVQRFVRLYGGTARYPGATWCLIDPLPPALTGVSFSGGQSAGEPVAIHWTPPAATPSGSKVVVKRWAAASCGTMPGGADTFDRALSPGTWQDSPATDAEDACFRVQLVNRYGAGRAAVSSLLRRWSAPPQAPVIGEVTWHPEGPRFRASASYPAGTHLVHDMLEDPQNCPGAYTRGQPVIEDDERLGDGVIEFMTPFPDQCVSFYAVDDETGQASEPTSVVVHAPLPSETVEVGDLRQEGAELNAVWLAVVTGRGAGNRVAAASVEGPCPDEVPDDLRWLTWDPAHPPSALADEYVVLSHGIGVHCALFTAMDWFGYQAEEPGRHGPVVMREFTQEGIAPPAVERVEWDDVNGVVVLWYSGVGWRRVVAQVNPADPGTCPTTFDPKQNYWSGYLENGIGMYPPAKSFCVSTFYYDDQPWGDVISRPVMQQVTVPD